MKRLMVLLALAGIGALLVACGGAGSTETDPGAGSSSEGDQTESTASDAEASRLADAALLQLADFPQGWRAEASDDDDEEDVCGDLSEEFDVQAERESDQFSEGEVPTALSAAAVLNSDDEAEEALAVLTNPSLTECFADELQSVAEDEGANADASFGELNVGNLGDESNATQVVVETETEGVSVDLYVDLIAVRVGPVASFYLFVDVFSPFDTASEEEIVGSAVARVAEAAGSDIPADDLEKRAAEAKVASADWPEAWCKVRIGMTRDGLVDLMGEPTERDSGRIPLIPDIENVPPDPVGSDTWEVAGSGEYNAFYDTDLNVQQLDGPSDIGCSEIRAK
jgi:hypothetical protein